jgi:hypothetical protein
MEPGPQGLGSQGLRGGGGGGGSGTRGAGGALIKKKIKFSSCIRKFRVIGCKVIYD